MGTLTIQNERFEFQWATDVSFDGIRLEILTSQGDALFDVSVPENGRLTVNTYSNEVSVDLVLAAVDVARKRG